MLIPGLKTQKNPKQKPNQTKNKLKQMLIKNNFKKFKEGREKRKDNQTNPGTQSPINLIYYTHSVLCNAFFPAR